MVPNGWYPTANNPGNADMVKAYIAKYGGTRGRRELRRPGGLLGR